MLPGRRFLILRPPRPPRRPPMISSPSTSGPTSVARPVMEFAAACLTLLACASSNSPFSPFRNPPFFTNSTSITNTYLPLSTLNQDILEGTERGKASRVQRTRQSAAKIFAIDGLKVPALVVEDRDSVAGELREVTLDYFAQSDDGAVYYLGEDVDVYQNGQVVGHDGAWLFGVNTTALRVLVPAKPQVGDKFRSEDVPGITQEDDEVVGVSESVTVPMGTYTNCLKVKETLDTGEIEYKYYAPNVGVVKEVPADGELSLQSHS